MEIPVARLADLVESKRDTGRLLLATHAEAIRDLITSEGRRGTEPPAEASEAAARKRR